MTWALLGLLVGSSHALHVSHVPHRFTPRSARCGAPLLTASPTNLEETISQTVSKDQVVIYSKSWCPYSAQVKALFDDMSQPWTAIELDQRDDGEQLQVALLTMTQQRTVPNVFIAGRHLITKDLCDLRDTPQPARSAKLDKWLLEGPPPPTAI